MSRFVLNIALVGALAGAMMAQGQTHALAQERAPSEVLDGLDPVLLVRGEEVFGKSNLTITRGRFEYFFATPDTRDAFEQDPAAYEVQNGGLCQRMGGAVSGSPSFYAVHDGRIYLFGTEDCRKLFVANPKQYFAPPVPELPADAAAAARASALLARAVEATGGAAVDAVQTYVERGTYVDHGPMGERTVTEIVTRRPPDALRIDRTFTMDGRTVTGSTVATAGEAFYLSQQRAYPVMEAGRPSLTVQLMRHPVMLLRARRDPQFKAAALGAAPLPGDTGSTAAKTTSVERVGVRVSGIAATLGIDPETGRVLSLSYVDRDPQGRYGEIVTTYTDFRRVSGGLTLPFAARTFVDGTPESSLARTWSEINVNTLLDASVFTRPPAPPGRR